MIDILSGKQLRHQTGKRQFQTGSVDLRKIVARVVAEPTGYGAGHRVQIDTPDDLPTIKADSRRVERVRYNLMGTRRKIRRRPERYESTLRKTRGLW